MYWSLSKNWKKSWNMMFDYKTKIIIVFLISIFFLNILSPLIVAKEFDEPNAKKVLVIYDRRNYFGYKCDEITSAVHLFYHFNVVVDEVSVSSYKKGMLQNYDSVVFIGISDKVLDKALLVDLAEYTKPLLFLGRGVKTLIDYKYSKDIVFEGEAHRPVKVIYNGKEFNLSTERFYQRLRIKNPDGQIISSLSDGKNLYPYVVKLSNLWYVSCLDTDEKALFYILADILHDFFEEYHAEKPKIYVRIEDVHCQRSPKELYQIADYLYEENIPFMVAMIPAFFDIKTERIQYLKDNKRFVKAVKYMQDLGGTILLHGYTHQIHKDMPGEGFEFWDGENDCPLDVDMEKWVDERINAGIDECVEQGIFPLGFEAPHYAVSNEGYINLKKYFSTIVGHLQTSDKGFTTTIYPYRLFNSPIYNQLIPENLDYVDPDDTLYKQHILEELDKVSIVRDYTAGFFFHPYLDIALLKEIIPEIKKRDVQFLDLKREENWVRGKNCIIKSQEGNIQIEDLREKQQELPIISFFKKAVSILIILVFLICLRLFGIFLKARKKSRESLFKDEGF